METEDDTMRGSGANAYRSGRRYRIVRNGMGWHMEQPNDDNVRHINLPQAGPSYTAMNGETFIAVEYAPGPKETGAIEGVNTVKCPVCGALPLSKSERSAPDEYMRHDMEAHKRVLKGKQ